VQVLLGPGLSVSFCNKAAKLLFFDNFSAGKLKNLNGPIVSHAPHLKIVEGDIRSASDLKSAIGGCCAVVHLAAMVSVPKSLENPLLCHEINVSGFQNVLEVARKEGIRRVVYSSSSAVYGRQHDFPIKETAPKLPLSPYGASKLMNEVIAATYSEAFDLQTIGLRYFNVFGPGQNPDGDYAAVIPKWMRALIRGEQISIYGDGSAVRDFIFVGDVANANVKSALLNLDQPGSHILNVGSGRPTSLLQLAEKITDIAIRSLENMSVLEPRYKPARIGEIPKSYANVSQMHNFLGALEASDFKNSLEITFKDILKTIS
jgi:UDP-N-acetylglucosamine/UDP-N-acetylgalactosamine 4-epimerase